MLSKLRKSPEKKSKQCQQHILNNHKIPMGIHHAILSSTQYLTVFQQVLSPVISNVSERFSPGDINIQKDSVHPRGSGEFTV